MEKATEKVRTVNNTLTVPSCQEDPNFKDERLKRDGAQRN